MFEQDKRLCSGPTALAITGWILVVVLPQLLVAAGPATAATDRPSAAKTSGAKTLPFASSERGYTARACGLDMDRDGLFGELEDCQVCDGWTTDPDHDGIEEDLIYIDCEHGTDDDTCGSPTQPCRSLAFAWQHRADGNQDLSEDILCFRNVCTTEEDVFPSVSGVPGHYVLPRSGSQARDWQLPTNPAMLVGWDSDDDGEYPPYDSDDVAVLDGGPNRLRRAFYFNLNGSRSYIEMAHFTVQDYGRFTDATQDRGFLRAGRYGGQPSSHVYFHDLELVRINRGLFSQSSTSVFNLFRGGTQPIWWAFVNLSASDTSSWFVRGSGPNDPEKENGPYRFQNVTVTVHGCDVSECEKRAAATMFKLWGYVRGIEILDSRFDLQVDVWTPARGGYPSGGVNAAHCSRDWTIRNNEFIDFKRLLKVQGEPQGCKGAEARAVDDVVLDRNLLRNHFDWGNGDPAIQIGKGTTLRETVEDVTITNNYLSSTESWVACIWSEAGNDEGPNPGTITIVGNTCHGDVDRFAALMIGDGNGDAAAFPQQKYILQNNIFAGLETGDLNLWIHLPITEFTSDFNVYDEDAGFRWLDDPVVDLATWCFDHQVDHQSRACVPRFVDAANGDFHLGHHDQCARDNGLDINAITDKDFENQARGHGAGWDIGADEVH